MITVAEIADALANECVVWRSLDGVRILRRDGRPVYTTGNAAVTFRAQRFGRDMMLKCYTRRNPNLAAIYGDAFRPRELCVFRIDGSRQWVDCLLCERVEGETLDTALCRCAAPQDREALARAFDDAALRLLLGERAHGDLKPENTVITPDGRAVFIDWDAAFLPSLAPRRAVETGTAAFQHPLRTADMYDKHIDDYPAAFISVMLHAAAVDEETARHYIRTREFPLHPKRIAGGDGTGLRRIADLFASRGMAPQYRLARMLASPSPYLFAVAETLGYACSRPRRETPPDQRDDGNPRRPCRNGRTERADSHDTADNTDSADAAADGLVLDQKDGLWGYRLGDEWRIPPLYDRGFDPSDGIVLAETGGYSHFMACDGTILATFGSDAVVKPFRRGCAEVRFADGSTRTLHAAELLLKNDATKGK